MDCMGFMETARFLENSGTCEADFRSAVSRSYYACYLSIRMRLYDVSKDDWVRLKGFFSLDKLEHRIVRKCLADCSIPEVNYIGCDFKTLQAMRKSADYDMDSSITEDHASEAIQIADRIVDGFAKVDQTALQVASSEFIAWDRR